MRDALPEPWVLVLHGLYMSGLERFSSGSKLVISAVRRPETEIPALIASASAGLAYYRADNINQTLTAFASEKLARYLCAGIPVVTHGIGNIHRLFDRYPCGIEILEPRQITTIIKILDKNAESFQAMARKAAKLYFFEAAGRDVLRFFREFAAGQTCSAQPSALPASTEHSHRPEAI